jgi:5'-nucleotidase
MRTRSMFYALSLVLALSLLLASSSPASAATKPASVSVQVLAVNDFHGALAPNTVSVPNTSPTQRYYAGGAAYLAARLNDAAAANPNTVKVSAGDMIGASPLLSAAFHDEPTIQAFNLMGFDFSAVGNHEFDEGWQELLRMQYGGCHPTDGCFTGPGIPPFTGANFKYLASNVIRLDNGQTLFPAYMVKQFGGIKVAFIGVSLESTPTIVVPSGVAGLEFQPEVDAINHYVKYLKDTQDIKAFVVLLHDGAGPAANANACNASDPFFTNVVMKVDPEVDALVTGHSHNAYNCQVTVKKNYGPMLVTSAGSNGRYYTDIDLNINGTSGQVASSTALNVEVVDGPAAPSTTPPITAPADPNVAALISAYNTIIGPIANRVVGLIATDFTRVGSAAGESTLGDLLTDAQLSATKDPGYGDAVIAMTNPGGIRADLPYAQNYGGELPGQVTYGEAFAVQPFSNSLVTMTLTGAQIKAALEQQFIGCGQPANGQKILQVSAGFSYSWSASAVCGSKISNMMLNGVAIDPATSYRVTVNNFLAGGGDNFTAFKNGTNLLTGVIDLDAFVAYLEANQTPPGLTPGPQNRISLAP